MESVIIAFVISIVTAGAAFLVKFYFSSLESRISKLEKENEDRFKEVDQRLERLNEAYGKIFNEILTKFSNWEDRIRKITDDLLKDLVPRVGTVKEAIELTENAFRGFDSETEREIMSIKKEVENLDRNIKSVEKAISTGIGGSGGSAAVTNALRDSLFKISNDVENMQTNNTKRHYDLRDKIAILHTVCKSINADCRRIDEKVRQLQEDTKQRIVLK